MTGIGGGYAFSKNRRYFNKYAESYYKNDAND